MGSNWGGGSDLRRNDSKKAENLGLKGFKETPEKRPGAT